MKTLNPPEGQMAGRKVRLWGVDGYESDQENGPAATKFTKDWFAQNAPDGIYDETPYGKDSYGRVLSVVKAKNGRILNEDLLSFGYAVASGKHDTHGYRQLQKDAQAAKVGAWGNDKTFWTPRSHRRCLRRLVGATVVDRWHRALETYPGRALDGAVGATRHL